MGVSGVTFHADLPWALRVSSPVGARGVDARVVHVSRSLASPPDGGVLPVSSVQARVLSGACPPLCTTLWTAVLNRGVVVHNCVHPCGSGVSRCRCSSWFRGKHLAPRGRLRTASAVGAEWFASLRMPARASDAIHAAPASADSLPCGVPRETESPGPGTGMSGLAVDDPRRRRVRRFLGDGLGSLCRACGTHVEPVCRGD